MTLTPLSHRGRFGCIIAMLPLWMLGIPGCQSTGEPAGAEATADPFDADWRSQAPATTAFGVDARAREIERNLGVR